MAEAERAFARERLALEHSLTNLDSPVMQVESSGGSICSVRHHPYLPTDLVPGFKEGDDIRQWLREYEEALVACRIPEKDWGTVLESYIPEVERDVLLAPEGSDRQGYPHIRKALIEKYGLTHEDYRLRFRGSRKRSHQSWEDFMGNCCKALTGWVEGSRATTYQGLFSLILREHMFRCCFSEIRQHLSYCEFSDPRELAKEADLLGSPLEGVGEVLGNSGQILSGEGAGSRGTCLLMHVLEGTQKGPQGWNLTVLGKVFSGEGVGLLRTCPLTYALEGSFPVHRGENLTNPDNVLSGEGAGSTGTCPPPQVLEGTREGPQGGRVVVTKGQSCKKDALKSEGEGGTPGNRVAPTLEISSTTPQRGVQVLPFEGLREDTPLTPVQQEGIVPRLEDQIMSNPLDLGTETAVTSISTDAFSRDSVPTGGDSQEDTSLTPVQLKGDVPRLEDACPRDSVPVRESLREGTPLTHDQPKDTVPRLENTVQGSSLDLEVEKAVPSLSTITSGGITLDGRVRNSRRRGRRRKGSFLTPAQPEGKDPGLGDQLQGGSSELVGELTRTETSTLAVLYSGGTTPRRRRRNPRRRGRRRDSPLDPIQAMGPVPRLEDQWQGVTPELVGRRVEKGCHAPGAPALPL
ncbi:hypothetical protein NDU88_001755 [Pleurodeles waltl]|uniref:Uncharacterized protein n=1 Tax=Pleurodeles waltl TaxID=8319 RepID=A0AAV7T053_PLEWA|nr:hypothetical protein NDU88_001755 [Pleurodeles waltl]